VIVGGLRPEGKVVDWQSRAAAEFKEGKMTEEDVVDIHTAITREFGEDGGADQLIDKFDALLRSHAVLVNVRDAARCVFAAKDEPLPEASLTWSASMRELRAALQAVEGV
jgi:hypothetical protein